MKHIDAVRGFQRDILFAQEGYATTGGNPLTNCVVEVVEMDWQCRSPVLSLRFYNRPSYSAETARQSAEAGHPLYDEDTPIGIEINLGAGLAQSLVEQISAKWPEFAKTVEQSERED